jgi:hypothetical protein
LEAQKNANNKQDFGTPGTVIVPYGAAGGRNAANAQYYITVAGGEYKGTYTSELLNADGNNPITASFRGITAKAVSGDKIEIDFKGNNFNLSTNYTGAALTIQYKTAEEQTYTSSVSVPSLSANGIYTTPVLTNGKIYTFQYKLTGSDGAYQTINGTYTATTTVNP